MMTNEERVYLPQISDYQYGVTRPYNQYYNDKGLETFFELVNEEIKETLQAFFREFAQNINLKMNTNVSRSYSTFYLRNYFGMSEVPDPTSQKFRAKYNFDDPNVKYDSLGVADGLPIRYDELLSEDEKSSSFLTSDEWAAIAVVMLDYSFEVKNLDFVNAILAAFYKVNTNEELDFTTFKYEITEKFVRITLPRNDTASANAWGRFVLINDYNPELIGLPYGKIYEFVLQESADVP